MPQLDSYFLKVCELTASLSKCKRNQVGAILVKDNNVIAMGYNGTPHGFDNCCEENGKTKDLVLHAESNVLSKCLKNGVSSDGSVLYCTLLPCIQCAKLIIQAGIKEVNYFDNYRDLSGLQLLNQANIKVRKWQRNYPTFDLR